eukprot:TRINITY_DN4316_c0_g1_i2.p1 TRINITY_DN4316_c0_g1~~TRINITY_DN4316_c0_g1_i2.p1  ORF type:complete len:396 (+),score=100.98 TRINITY_DN4316_c0_g1_i2:29-1189(+)
MQLLMRRGITPLTTPPSTSRARIIDVGGGLDDEERQSDGDNDDSRGLMKSKSMLALFAFVVVTLSGVFVLSIAGMPHLYASHYRGAAVYKDAADTEPEVSNTMSIYGNSVVMAQRLWTQNINAECDCDCEFVPQVPVPIDTSKKWKKCPLEKRLSTLNRGVLNITYEGMAEFTTVDEQELVDLDNTKTVKRKEKKWKRVHGPVVLKVNSEYVRVRYLQNEKQKTNANDNDDQVAVDQQEDVLLSVLPSPSPTVRKLQLKQAKNKKSSVQEEELSVQPNIFVLSIDSISRANFFRALPKTSSFLSRLSAPSGDEQDNQKSLSEVYRSFIFNRYNAMLGTSASNLTPMLSGRYFDMEKWTEKIWATRKYLNSQVKKGDWIWQWLKSKV